MTNVDTSKLPFKFGPYYIFDYIGKGGMAEIFLAKEYLKLGIERFCVIKRILPALNERRDFCEMLINEAKICSNLSHANVVQTFELGQIENQYYIAMEYVEGVDLNRLLGILSRGRVALPLPFALFIIIETLKGLDYAHRYTDSDGKEYNIVHRDVSPTNVLISKAGEVKLCDFGIAKVSMQKIDVSEHVDEEHVKGKVAYMAPEHIAGEEIDRRADLYAAGILLWELLSGRRLFKSKNPDETFKKALNAEVPELEDKGFSEYEMLKAIVARALSKDRDKRFLDGQSFISAIEDYLHLTGQVVSELKFAQFLNEHIGQQLEEQYHVREERRKQLQEMVESGSDKVSMLSVFDDSASEDFKEETAYVASHSDLLAAKFEKEEQKHIEPEQKADKKFNLLPVLIVSILIVLIIIGYIYFR